MLRKIVKKEHYIYNNYEEVKSWEEGLLGKRIEDIEPEIFFRVLEESNQKFIHPSFSREKI